MASCRLSAGITLEECYEAICKFDNVITRENIKEDNRARLNKIRRLETHSPGDNNVDTSYKPYKEWMNLTAEQRKEIHRARGERKNKNWNQNKNKLKEETKINEENEEQRNKKRPRRLAFQDQEEP